MPDRNESELDLALHATDSVRDVDALGARGIAEALRMTKRGAIKRADVEAWPFVASRARGGMQ